MKTRKNQQSAIRRYTIPATVAGAFAVAVFAPSELKMACAGDSANAAPSAHLVKAAAKVVDITAKKYEFSPAEIKLKKGEPVTIRLTSTDRAHGFLVKPLGIDADIQPGKTTEVTVMPQAAGEYTVMCDHYCGTGHGGMKIKLSVVN